VEGEEWRPGVLGGRRGRFRVGVAFDDFVILYVRVSEALLDFFCRSVDDIYNSSLK
jgi:hypothetical protein